MKYSDFIKVVAKEANLSQADTKRVIDSANNIIKDAVKSGDEVVIHGLGKFTMKHRPARTGINPATKETIKIAATNVPAFKVGKEFKDHVNS